MRVNKINNKVHIKIELIHILSINDSFSFNTFLLKKLVNTEYIELIGVTIIILPKLKAKEFKTLPIGVIPVPSNISLFGFFNLTGVTPMNNMKIPLVNK